MDQLTEREMQVLSLVAQGKTNKQIGYLLGIKPRTARKHIFNVRVKLGADNTANAVWKFLVTEIQTLVELLATRL